MKTRTIAFSLMLTFASCAVFANDPSYGSYKMDKVATDTIPKDTIPPKKDTTSMVKTVQVKTNSNLRSTTDKNYTMREEPVIVGVEKEITTSGK
jgi:hypothetical protein